MAETYAELGLLEEAMPHQERALAVSRRVLGDDDPDTLASIHNMGVLLLVQGQAAEAELYLRESMEGRRRVLGDNHPVQ